VTIREHRAKALAAFTAALVAALAVTVAFVQRHSARGAADGATPRGRFLYEANGCARCHSIGGAGSPRAPLDGVGDRLSAAEVDAWITADPAIAHALPGPVVAAKSAYRTMSDADRRALADWLVGATAREP
jgi:mono/diheme cytochrome c family protein